MAEAPWAESSGQVWFSYRQPVYAKQPHEEEEAKGSQNLEHN
jgi:hypothetical protein